MQNSNISWINGAPFSLRFSDPYFSAQDGLAETKHVFLAGNNLPARFRPGFHIAELGFGTGLNMLAAWKCWEESGQTTALKFTSFEAFPLTVSDMKKALAAWPELGAHAARFFVALQSEVSVDLPSLRFNMVLGDARQTLPLWQHQADAWFLDGFSPAKNPALWTSEILSEVGQHSAPDATCATYSAAGHVRRGLSAAGFKVSRIKGHGKKRHMNVGKMIHDAK